MTVNHNQKRWWHRTWFILTLVTIFGALWRLYVFSGDGLGDDSNFFSAYYGIFSSGHWQPSAYNYRIGLWLPILLFWKLFGVRELTWILPITAASVACIPLIYLLGRRLFSERNGLIAAALLAAHPFDVLTSTLFVNDIPFSLYTGLAILFFLLALQSNSRQSWLWFVLSAFLVFWSYLTKFWALFTLPIFGLISLINYRKWKSLLVFYVSLLAFFSASLFVDLQLTSDPFGYYHAEVQIAGLCKATHATLLEYPRQMFLPNQYGRFFHGIFCWFAIPALFIAASRWRKTYISVIWLLLIFLTMEFMPQKVTLEGWYSQARIFRYLSVLVIPSCLILAFAAGEIIRKWHKMGWGTVGLFLCLALVQSYRVAWPSRNSFDDVRRAAQKIVTHSRKPIYSDYMMMSHIERFHLHYEEPNIIRYIGSGNPRDREFEFLKISNAYVITGGARLPYYGCDHCTPNVGFFRIPDYWKLVWILDKPTMPWRREPLRIWEVGSSPEMEKELSHYRDAHELYDAALKQFFAGDYALARIMFKLIQQMAPRSVVRPWAWWYYCITFMRQGVPEMALIEFKIWLTYYRGHELEPEIYYHIGLCYKDMGQVKEAKKAFLYVLEKFPKSAATSGSRDVLEEIILLK